MNTDKIKSVIGDGIWNHWNDCKDVDRMKSARDTLYEELREGVTHPFLKEKLLYEYRFLCMRTGVAYKL